MRSVWMVLGVLATAGTASAAEFVVTNSTDSETSPAAGSFRSAMLSAKAGDTVRFDSFRIVKLVAPITMDASQHDVTVVGPGQLSLAARTKNAPLIIAAARVTLDRVTFFDCDVQVGQLADDVKVVGCLFSGNRSGISIDRAKNGVIGTTAQPNSFFKVKDAVHTFTTDGTKVEANDFDGCDFAVTAANDTSITIRDNTVTQGTIHGTPQSGTISGNTITADSLAGIHVSEMHGSGLLTISENDIDASGTADGIEVQNAGSVLVASNRLKGAGRVVGIRVLPRNEIGDAVEISGNTVDGFQTGILVSATSAPGPDVTVSGNDVKNQRSAGITVGAFAPGRAAVSTNTLTANGRGTKGTGIFVASFGSEVGVAENTVTGTGGDGIVVGRDSSLVTLTDNVVDGSKDEGISVSARAKASVRGGRVTNSKGSGIFADAGSHLAMDGTQFGGNKGPEVDLAPSGATPNSKKKTANDDLDFPAALIQPVSGDVKGTTVPAGRVTVYGPGVGGLLSPLSDWTADGSGAFTIPKASLPAGDVRILVHAPDDGDVSELTRPLKFAPPDDGTPGDDDVVYGTPEPGPGGVTADLTVPPGPYVVGATIVLRYEIQNPNPTPVGPYEYEFRKTTKLGEKSIGLFHDVTLIPAQSGGGYEMLTSAPVVLVAGKNKVVCLFGGKALSTVTITAR